MIKIELNNTLKEVEKKMKRFVVVFLSLFLVMSWSGNSWAQDAKKIAVLPFSVHSSEDIGYVKNGVWDMLFSRLSAAESLNVIDKAVVSNALAGLNKKDLNIADVYGIGKKLDADFIVWGSITKIGNNVSLDGKLLDVSTYKMPVGIFEQAQGLDGVIPKISNFAQRINYHIIGKVPATPDMSQSASSNTFNKPVAPSAQVKEPIMAEKALTTSQGTFTSIINPDYINANSPLDKKGFWMSQRYPTGFTGMDIGDVNGDGLNEVVVIDSYNVMIYQKTDKSFKLIKKIAGKRNDKYLAVDVADINCNGIKEIFVTNMKKTYLASFVLEYKDGDFVLIDSDLRLFLRLIEKDEGPIMLGQKMGIDEVFGNPIHEIVWKGGEYKEGRTMKIPKGLSVYGLTVASLGGGVRGERVLALNEYDHLCVYRKTKKPLNKIETFGGSDDFLWKSSDIFGGSNSYFQSERQKQNRLSTDTKEYVYINPRILTYDTNKNGKKEVIIVKNLSPIGRIFGQLKVFSASEIYNLEWDGLGMAENWRTRRIEGYVADYQFKDIDNDGQKELVLAIGLSKGVTASQSIIAAYELNK